MLLTRKEFIRQLYHAGWRRACPKKELATHYQYIFMKYKDSTTGYIHIDVNSFGTTWFCNSLGKRFEFTQRNLDNYLFAMNLAERLTTK